MSVEPAQDRYDIAVIGGGITGAGVARDAALRGLSCLLLEKGDFSSGTSSKTTRLIHGGLRYLEHGEVSLVIESLRERELLLRMAPHLIHPIPILLPVYEGDSRKLWKIRAGLWLYDLLSLGRGSPHHAVLGPRAAQRRAPFLLSPGLKGAGLFYDYQIPLPERLVMENVLSASEHGARCLNYSEVVAIEPHEDGFRLEVSDCAEAGRSSYTAAVVVNATGPWADRVCALYLRDLPPKVRPTKGAHVVVDADLDQAVFTSSPRDERLFFALPLDDLTLVGTTDTPWDADPDSVRVEPTDVAYLLDGLRKLMPSREVTRSDVLWAYAGLRPLAIQKRGKDPSSRSRSHVLHRDGPGGRFLTLAGGKYTTFRKMAEEAVDAACEILEHFVACSTDRVPLFGGGLGDRVIFRESVCEWARNIPDLPRDVVDHLVGVYGRRCSEVIELSLNHPPWTQALMQGYPDCGAQVVYAVRNEAARHIDDVIFRRLRLGLSPDRGLSAAQAVARIMAEERGWSAATMAWELERFEELVHQELVFDAARAARAS